LDQAAGIPSHRSYEREQVESSASCRNSPQFKAVLSLALDRLPTKKSAPEKRVLAAVMTTATSVSNEWLAERLCIGEPASVSQFVRRFRLAGGMERRDFRLVLSKITTRPFFHH
jgi:hypothetical protein